MGICVEEGTSRDKRTAAVRLKVEQRYERLGITRGKVMLRDVGVMAVSG